jgi:hypothetical protein
MTRLWTIPMLAAALTVAACSKDTSQAQPPAGDATAPPAATAPAEPAPAPPAGAAPRAATPARPSTAPPAREAAKPPQPTAAAPAVHEPPPPPKPTYHDVTVTSGTQIPLELLTSLSSETAEVETEVQGRTKQAIVVNGETVVPNGATLIGNVTDVASSGKVKGVARLAVRFTSVSYSGQRHRISTEPLSWEAESTKKKDAIKVGAGAGIGAAIGGIIGGGKGAAIGAGIGGGTGTAAVLATKGKEVELASGTAMTAVLTAPLTVTLEDRR